MFGTKKRKVVTPIKEQVCKILAFFTEGIDLLL
jgi:hypothetical protein